MALPIAEGARPIPANSSPVPPPQVAKRVGCLNEMVNSMATSRYHWRPLELLAVQSAACFTGVVGGLARDGAELHDPSGSHPLRQGTTGKPKPISMLSRSTVGCCLPPTNAGTATAT